MIRRRLTTRVLIVAVLSTTLLLPAVPAAPQEVAGGIWTLTTNPITIKRGGKAYQMTVTAFERAAGESVSISLSQTRDPAGAAKAVQSHTWNFTLSGDRFTHASTLATAKLATAKTMGAFGALNLGFAKNAATASRCSGHLKSRTGTISGSLSFKTGTSLFGTITNRPSKATLTYDDGRCGTTNATPCPAAGRSTFAYRDSDGFSLFASKSNGASTAFVTLYASETLKGGVGLTRMVNATLPASKVAIADGLGSGKISGATGTWLSGSAAFSPMGPANSMPPYPCGSGKEALTTMRPGEWKGTLKADFFAGADRGLGQGAVSGSASKTAVRSR